MSNAIDMLHWTVFVGIPLAAGLVLVGAAVRLAFFVLGRYEEWQGRRIENQRRRLSVDLVQPGMDGLLPVNADAIRHDPGAVLNVYLARLESQRTHPNVPHSITYSPHQSYQNRSDIQTMGGADVPQLMAPAADFWKLFHADQLPGNGFLLGFDLESNQPVIADWRRLYSALVGGQSGTGKSTLIRCLLAQAALQGASFVVVDPHMDAGDESLAHSLKPLQRLMLTAPAGSDDQIRGALNFVSGVVRDRLSGKDANRQPLVLVVDELTGLLSRSAVKDELIDTLGLITHESRKVGVYAFGIGQNFSGSLFPTEVRNCFVSMLSCRTRRDVARVMSGSNEFGKAVESLTTGQTVWMTPQGDMHRLSVPNTTQHHLELLARQLEANGAFVVDSAPTTGEVATKRLTDGIQATANEQASVATDQPLGSQPSAIPSAKNITITDAKVAHVKRLLDQRTPFPNIVAEVWGVRSDQGGKYQAARAELESVIYSLWGNHANT
jgi:hypothetical protein